MGKEQNRKCLESALEAQIYVLGCMLNSVKNGRYDQSAHNCAIRESRNMKRFAEGLVGLWEAAE